MASRNSPWVLAVGLAFLCFAPDTLAEPSAADKQTARSLMAKGRSDRDAGDLAAALKAFAAADAIMHVPTTGLELARTKAALGLLVEARDTALRVVHSPAGADDPAPFRRAREAASALSDDLERIIPSVTVTVSGVPAGAPLEVTLDGASLPTELLGEPYKLDPGHHVIAARSNQTQEKTEIDVSERDAKDVPLTLSVQQPSAVALADSTTPGLAAPLSPGSGRSPASVAMIYGGFGLAGAALLTGSISGALSISRTNSIRSSPSCMGHQCSPAVRDDLAWADSMATLSTVSFVVAGVGGVIGIVGLMTGAPPPPAQSAPEAPDKSARIKPWLGGGRLGVQVGGPF
jgi:hypothetical protein